MSNCWKCGKTLPEGQVECEYGCATVLQNIRPPQFEDLQAEAELAQELTCGLVQARSLAVHVDNMGAGAMKLEVEVNGRKYLFFVKRVA